MISRVIRVTLIALVGAGALFVSSTARSDMSHPSIVATNCSSRGVAQPFTHLVHIDDFGCRGEWSWVWATVGSGPMAVGVTEVEQWDTRTREWRIASRSVVCTPSLATTNSYVYRGGCLSN